MIRNNKKVFSLFVAMLLVVTMFSSFAEQLFTDVPEGDWSETYISRVTSSEIMPGFEDATFKPKALATKMETVVAIYRMLNASGKLADMNVVEVMAKHQDLINKYNVNVALAPYGNDNHKALAVALELKIIDEDDLKEFVIDGKFIPVKRLEAAVYVGKTLANYVELEEKKLDFAYSYKDKFDIPFKSAPYVDLLVMKEIVSATGDENGKFNAKASVNRDVLSVFIAGTLNELDGITGTGDTPDTATGDTTTPPSNTAVSGSFNGTISLVHTDKNIVEIRDDNNKLHVYSLDKAVISKGTETLDGKSLSTSQKVSFTISGSELTSIKITQDYEITVGVFHRISALIEEGGSKYRVLTMKDSAGKYVYKKIFLTTVIEKDYDIATFDQYKEGEQMTVSFDGFDAKKVLGFSAESVISGVLNRSTDFKKGSAVSVKLGTDNYVEEILVADLELIKLNGEDISKGDIVKLYLSNGKMSKVEATGLSSEDKGTLTEIIIGEKSYVSIERENGIIKKYRVSNEMVLNNLGTVDAGGIYVLRLDQDISVKMEGMFVSNISINKSVEKSKFQGAVIEIHKSSNIVKVRDGSGVIWLVSLNGDTSINISDFAIGDNVYVYGVRLSDDLFEAELVIVLE